MSSRGASTDEKACTLGVFEQLYFHLVIGLFEAAFVGWLTHSLFGCSLFCILVATVKDQRVKWLLRKFAMFVPRDIVSPA